MNRIRWWGGGVLLVFGLLLGGGRAAVAEKVALVIGNNEYRRAPLLDNPQRDAEEVAKALKDLGFTILGGARSNLKKDQMDAALKEFGARARSATAAVAYFSGHGIEVGGQNYLIPVDAELKHESDAPLEAVPLEVVLSQAGGARGYGLVILDACRDNPLADQMRLADGRTKGFGGSKGLKPVEPSGQVYVAYAAKSGTKAQEGHGQNSVYTAALLNRLRNYRQDPLPLPNLFGAVREDVLEATMKTQEPWLYGAFGRKPIFLTDEPAATPVATASVPSPSRPSVPQEAPPEGSRPQPGQVFRDTLSDGTRGPAMVVIPAGEFQMGSPESEAGREPVEVAGRERQHRVRIEKAFALGQMEVTVGEFRRFVDAAGYQTEAEKNGEGCYVWEDSKWQLTAGLNWRNPNFKQGDDHPVVCVSWNDAQAYVKWLSQETSQSYRLPTEAEWEYAARAGTTTARYWGDDPDQACRYANVADQTLGWTPMHNCRDGYTYAAPVGRFQPNAWGLKDMLGNVWEWICSAYDKDYSGAEQKCAKKDTTGPLAVRGGSWGNGPAWVRSASRGGLDPAYRSYDRGFRLARSF